MMNIEVEDDFEGAMVIFDFCLMRSNFVLVRINRKFVLSHFKLEELYFFGKFHAVS